MFLIFLILHFLFFIFIFQALEKLKKDFLKLLSNVVDNGGTRHLGQGFMVYYVELYAICALYFIKFKDLIIFDVKMMIFVFKSF